MKYVLIFIIAVGWIGCREEDSKMVKLGEYWVRVENGESLQDALNRLDSASGISLVFIDKYYEKGSIINPECLINKILLKNKLSNSDAIEPLRQEGIRTSDSAILYYDKALVQIKKKNRKSAEHFRRIGNNYDEKSDSIFSEWRIKLDSIKKSKQ